MNLEDYCQDISGTVFPIRNPFPKKKNIRFESSDKLPLALRGTTLLGRGEKSYVRFENVSKEEQILNPDREIGDYGGGGGGARFPLGRGREGGATPYAR